MRRRVGRLGLAHASRMQCASQRHALLLPQVYDRATRQYATEGKAYGRGLLPEDVEDALARFFLRRGGGGEEGRGRTGAATAEEVLDFYIGRLEALHDWFQRKAFGHLLPCSASSWGAHAPDLRSPPTPIK